MLSSIRVDPKIKVRARGQTASFFVVVAAVVVVAAAVVVGVQ